MTSCNLDRDARTPNPGMAPAQTETGGGERNPVTPYYCCYSPRGTNRPCRYDCSYFLKRLAVWQRTGALFLCLLACSLAGCALHHSGQLRAPRVGAVPPIAAGAVTPGQLVFAPQLVSKQLEIWSVRGCPGTAVSAPEIYGLAAAHGISYLEPATAATILATRTISGVIVQWGGYAAGAAALAMNVDWIKANVAWQRALSAAGAVLGWLVPALEKNTAPLPCTGADLMVDSRGCGGVMFCAQPSAVGAFTEVVK